MRARLDSFYRFLLVLLAAGLLGSIWLSAQESASAATGTQAPDAASTNAPPASTNTAPGSAFTGHTVSLLPTIDRKNLTFGLDRIPYLRERTLIGIPLWQYLASFLFIFIAFYVARFFDFLCGAWLKHLAARKPSRSGELILEVAQGPVKIVVFVILLHIGLAVFEWPPKVQVWLSNALKVVVACSLTYALLKVIDMVVGTWRIRTLRDDSHFDQQLLPILRNTFRVLVVVIAALVTLDNIGVNIAGLIASLSIGGLALGLAAQDTVANLFGAVSILIDKPFKVGDSVSFDGVSGAVETIGLRSTRIRNADGHLITVPNKTMGNATVTNVTQRPSIRTQMNIGLTFDTSADDIRRATELLEEIFKAHPNTADVMIGFNKFGDFSLNIAITHVWNNTDNKAYLRGMQDLNLEIKRRFDAEKIQFAFPTQTLHVRQDADPRGTGPAPWRADPRS